MAGQKFLTWYLALIIVTQCKSNKILNCDHISSDVSNLINTLNDGIFHLESELLSTNEHLSTTHSSFETLKLEVCSSIVCPDHLYSSNSILHKLQDLEMTIGESVNNSNAERLVSLSEIKRAIHNQKEAIEAIESAVDDIPLTEGAQILEHIRGITNKMQNNVEELPTPSLQIAPQSRNCLEAKQNGFATGTTAIELENVGETNLWCDQDTEDGGWTVMLLRRRQTPQLNFRRSWADYLTGFGELNGEHWIGLNALHELTINNCELMVTMKSGNETAASYYSNFTVDAGPSYRLHVSGYDGARSTGGDSLSYHDNMRFSNKDKDNDQASGGSCSEWSGGGGWWFNYCFFANPTGIHAEGQNPGPSDSYLEWRKWQGYHTYLSDFKMMIRPKTQ